jgi:hypothetical protein
MEITFRTRDLDWNETLQKQVQRSINSAVDRHRNRIARISVSLADVNGPRGGVDKLCQITADVRGTKPVLISETGTDLLAAVGRATRRLGYRIGSNIARRRRSAAPNHRATIRVDS